MKINCPGCQTKFALADSRVSSSGLAIKCPKCACAFSIQRPPPGQEGKVVQGVPLSSTGQMRVAVQDTVVDQTIVEKKAPGDGSATVVDRRAPLA